MTPTAEAEASGRPGLYRLLGWLSPAFPIGSFSYSHGLESAVAAGAVRDRGSLAAWIAAIVAHGSGRIDGDILRAAHGAAARGDLAVLDNANRRGAAYRASAELALESAQQGAAFVATCLAAWPEDFIAAWADLHSEPPPPAGEGRVEVLPGVCYAAAFGAVAARAGITLDDALVGYLQALAGNLVSAALRLGIVGQTDGQRILAGLEPVVIAGAAAAMSRGPEDFGTATFAADLASMAHETQYTRLFRS